VAAEETVHPASSSRLGAIEITLPSGIHVAVDSFATEKALARVLRALEHGA